MRPRLLLTINWKFAVDFFARGLHTRTAVARLPLRQLGFLVIFFVFFAQRPGRTARRTATNEGSKCVFPAKEVPFGGLNNKK